MKRTVKVLFGAACVTTLAGWPDLPVWAEEISGAVFSGLEPGVCIDADDGSETGYTVTFVYENTQAESVQLEGLFGFAEVVSGAGPANYAVYTPYEWKKDLNLDHCGDTLTFDMKKDEDSGYWTLSMPLPSGAYNYGYIVDGAGTAEYDPLNYEEVFNSNAPEEDPSRIYETIQKKSYVYVPFDAEKQTYDWSFAFPVEEPYAGTTEFVMYDTPSVFDSVVEQDTATFDKEQGRLSIYLPAGYDPNREDPYKVLYFSHGGRGNEVSLLHNVNHADNVIMDGDAEGFIMVGWNCYASPSDKVWPSWYDWKVLANLTQNIIPYMEENYNVVKDSSGRAICGFSAGAGVAHFALLYYSDLFDYYGMWDGGESTHLPEDYAEFAGRIDTSKVVMIGSGSLDTTPSGSGEEKTVRYEHMQEAYTGLKDVVGMENIFWHDAHSAHDNFSKEWLENIFFRTYLWR